ncbi:hypothetical protein Cgig2_005758 [Carnegiea gigantea]|uniref:Uncharacterized protein n=1 Tax=Carnegiea gigantea TaxID=171969 RepID=A0A9Q1GL31_9CARY|nr:hypothetical protein Cgig2_005758 [Carnegiea gigantea]
MLGTPLSPFIVAFPLLYDTREMADYVRESFIWRWRRAMRLPCSIFEDYHVLCPRFSLPEAKRAAANFELPKMVQATFYVILLNGVVELGVVRGFMADGLKSSLLEQAADYVRDNFRWALKEPSAPGPKPLPSDYHGLCLRFDLGVATRYAHDSNILEMVQIIFYAMVIDDAAKLGLSRRLTMDCVMWVMRKLDWGPVEAWLGDNDRRLRIAQTSCPANPRASPDNLRWSVRESSSLRPNLLPLHFMVYCPEFDHIMAMQFAHIAHIPEMVQVIFYATVINDAAELRLIRRETGESLMLDLQEQRLDIIEAWLLSIEDKLKDAQIPYLVETVYNPRPRQQWLRG